MTQPDLFSLETHRSEQSLRIVVKGEIDLAAEETLVEAVSAALAGGDEGLSLVLDLSGVAFMDSSGLRAVLRSREEAISRGAAFSLAVTPDGPVARLFDVAGVAGRFDYA